MFRTPTLWKYTTREVQRRPGRTLLTLAGIVIGVATVVAILATTRATRRSYRAMYEAVGGRASLEVVAVGQGGFDAGDVEQRLRGVGGLDRAVGVIQGQAGLVGAGEVRLVLVLGYPAGDGTNGYRVKQGQGLEGGKGLLLEETFARQQGYALGDRVKLGTGKGLVELPLGGLVEAKGAALFNGGAFVLVPLGEAQRLFGMPGKVNSVRLELEESAGTTTVEEEVRGCLPPGLRVQAPAERAALGGEGIASINYTLDTLSVVSLVGGAFVILNSFLMNLGERRRQLAILRALGTTRRQVTRLLLREAVLLGGVGTVLGMGAGVFLAQSLLGVQEQILGVKLPPLQLTAQPFLLALLLGPGMALAATVVPAWRAGRRSPLEAMLPRRSTPEPGEARPGWVNYLGIAAVATAVTFTLGSGRWWPAATGVTLMPLAFTLMLVGCVVALPLVLGALLRLARLVLRRPFGTEGMLALRQLERQRTRTALTAGVLFIGVIVTVGFGNTLHNSIRDIDTWYRNTIPADFLVRRALPDSGTLSSAALPEELLKKVSDLDGVAPPVGRLSFVQGIAAGQNVIIIARDFLPGRPLPMALVEGTEEEVREGLRRGGVAVGTALAQRAGVQVGDDIVVQTRRGEEPLRVAAVIKEYTAGGMGLYLDWEEARRLLAMPGVHGFEVYAEPGGAGRVEKELRTLAREQGLLIQSNAELRAQVDTNVQAFEAFMWMLIALLFVVASLGIVNTLTMNIHEQTRELGVLRAIGMRRAQVGRGVVAQALALGVLSVLPGVVVGIGMSYIMNLATRPLIGHVMAFRVSPGFVAACAGLALVVAVLASLLPARRAARLHVIQALHYE
ncbi:MAG: ABC transporter permease [Planctomycetes bacterium]|nr:ABC transporter permease [Planctomycetota bacterium]